MESGTSKFERLRRRSLEVIEAERRNKTGSSFISGSHTANKPEGLQGFEGMVVVTIYVGLFAAAVLFGEICSIKLMPKIRFYLSSLLQREIEIG